MMQAPGVSDNPTLLATLAAAYAATGRFPEATSITKRVIGIFESQGHLNQVALHRKRLAQFERNEALSE